MFPLTRIQCLVFVAAGALVTLSAASTPARTDEMVQNLGPVGPHEPILTPVGSKRVIAFYEPDGGQCAFQAVVWNGDDTEAKTASRVRLSLNQGQIAHIDSVEDKSLDLRCVHQTLSIISEPIKFGPTE